MMMMILLSASFEILSLFDLQLSNQYEIPTSFRVERRNKELGDKLPFKSVDTPVAKSPREATASEPPRSTILAMVPP
jgi:hypothetical protein